MVIENTTTDKTLEILLDSIFGLFNYGLCEWNEREPPTEMYFRTTGVGEDVITFDGISLYITRSEGPFQKTYERFDEKEVDRAILNRVLSFWVEEVEIRHR